MNEKKIGSSEINDFIKGNTHLDDRELAEVLKISSNAVRHRRRAMGIFAKEKKKYDTIDTEIHKDIEERKKKVGKWNSEEKYEEALTKIDELELELNLVKSIEDVSEYEIKPKESKKGQSEATAVIVASDWHCEESVERETVNGLNEYNLDIARKRAESFFQNALRLVEMNQKDVKIDTVVLALLGDFISGSIHDELMESNNLQTIDALVFAQELIASGIRYILNNSELDIVIPCHSGNHGRTTKKQRFSTERGNSFEYYMYHNLAGHFSNEPRVKFLISGGYLSYVKVYDYTLRFHHGHSMKYGGGGGIFIPAFKAISQWNKSRWAHMDIFGHFHQYRMGGNFICNGSLIGYNAYAVAIKAEYEKPCQAFFLVNKNHGFEMFTKIRIV